MQELVVRAAYGRFPKTLSQESGNDITAVPQQDTTSPIPFREWTFSSHPPYKTIHDLLLARLVERDRELVAVDHDHVAVAELLVEHAIADANSEIVPVDLATSSPSMVSGPERRVRARPVVLSTVARSRGRGAVRDGARSLSGFGFAAEWDRCNDCIDGVLLKLGISAQLVDRARLGERSWPVLCGEFENIGGLLHGLVDCVAGSYDARHIGKRYPVAAIRILVDQGDVVRHLCGSLNPFASQLAYRCC